MCYGLMLNGKELIRGIRGKWGEWMELKGWCVWRREGVDNVSIVRGERELVGLGVFDVVKENEVEGIGCEVGVVGKVWSEWEMIG